MSLCAGTLFRGQKAERMLPKWLRKRSLGQGVAVAKCLESRWWTDGLGVAKRVMPAREGFGMMPCWLKLAAPDDTYPCPFLETFPSIGSGAQGPLTALHHWGFARAVCSSCTYAECLFDLAGLGRLGVACTECHNWICPSVVWLKWQYNAVHRSVHNIHAQCWAVYKHMRTNSVTCIKTTHFGDCSAKHHEMA